MTPVSPWSLRPRHILAFAEPLLFWLARAFAWLHRESQFARAHFGESGIQRHWREEDEELHEKFWHSDGWKRSMENLLR